MALTVVRKFPPLMSEIKWTRDDWQLIGNFIVERITTRTQRGVDGQNQPFTPYSQSYGDTRRQEGFPSAPVNLKLSGEMLASMIVLPSDRGVTITFRK